MPTPFHLAIPVRDLDATPRFYREALGCATGRSSEHWIDLNLYGHQLVLHRRADGAPDDSAIDLHNQVDGDAVPVPHFGVVLEMNEFETLAARLREYGVRFLIEPRVRFSGLPGEQATMFFLDPSGNALEFKAFADIAGQLFARE